MVTSRSPGLAGAPVRRPALNGDREGLLGGVLGEVEVAEEADQPSQDPAPLLADDLLEGSLPVPFGLAYLDGAT